MSAIAASLGNSEWARSACSGSVAMMYVPTPRMRRDTCRSERAQVGVGAQDQVPAANRAVGCMQVNAVAGLFVAQRLRPLENRRSGGLRGTRDTQSELEGMQVTAARVEKPAEIPAAAHMGLQLVPIEQAHRFVGVLAAQLVEPLGKLVEMPRLGGDMDVVGAVVALDAMLFDERAVEIERFDRQVEQPPCILAPDL